MSERAFDYLSDVAGSETEPLAICEWLADYDVARCYYCGEPAGTVDHVVPQSMLEKLRILGDDATSAIMARHGRRMTVPACLECNVLLGPKYFSTLEQRKLYLKKRLRLRYKRILSMPEWSDRELSQLGPRLQEYVIHSIGRQQIIRRRVSY